ncbi:MAG TPA: hypothetical protein GXZ36_04055 [Firmicutes bacterium]|nr:hypothetical protein [Bacillota bacterium]
MNRFNQALLVGFEGKLREKAMKASTKSYDRKFREILKSIARSKIESCDKTFKKLRPELRLGKFWQKLYKASTEALIKRSHSILQGLADCLPNYFI